MDLTPIANLVMSVAAATIVPIAGLLVHKGISVAQARLHLQLSAADQAVIDTAVSTGAGLLRAKLVNGTMALPDVSLGNPHVDQAAQFALDVAEKSAWSTGVTRDDLAKRIIGAVGHALGQDPSVPSVLIPEATPATRPAPSAERPMEIMPPQNPPVAAIA